MSTINNTTEANEAIGTLFRLKRDIESEKILLDDAVEKLTRASLNVAAPLAAQYAALETELLGYITTNKREICRDGRKSIELAFGTIGIENSPPALAQLKGFSTADTAKLLLKSPAYKHCAKVTYSYIKESVKALNLAAEKLARFGLRLTQTKDKPFFTFNETTLADRQ